MMSVLNILNGLNKFNLRNVIKKNSITNSRFLSSEIDEDQESIDKTGN